MFENLVRLLDENGDGELSQGEILDGWRQKWWLAQPLSRQIIEHDSEWGLPLSYWEDLGEKFKEDKTRTGDDMYNWGMKKKVRLYRAEFYDTCPKGQTGAARFRRCGTVVGFWPDVTDAVEQTHRNYWVEVFDAVTNKRLAGPLPPHTQMPDTGPTSVV